jgi:hypothetical protein
MEVKPLAYRNRPATLDNSNFLIKDILINWHGLVRAQARGELRRILCFAI